MDDVKASELIEAANQPEVDAIVEVEPVEDGTSTPPAVENEEAKELPKGIQKRFSTLTKRTNDLARKNLELLEYIRKQESQKAAPPAKSRDEMTDDEWIASQVAKELRAREELYAQEAQARAKREAASRKDAEATAKQFEEFVAFAPDLKETLEDASDLQLPKAALEFLGDSDIKVLLAYKIAKDEAIQDKLDALAEEDPSGRKVQRFLGKLELKVENELESAKSNAKPSSSSAGKPVGSVTSGGVGKTVVQPWEMSNAEYRRWKAAQK